VKLNRDEPIFLPEQDLKLVKAHLQVARWNIEQVKKSIRFVGQSNRSSDEHTKS